jgi:hypothetical protein
MGNFLDDLFKKVFKSAEKLPINVKENFTIKESELKDLEQWFGSGEYKALFSLIYKNYHFKRTQINEHPQIHLFSSPYANGFAVSYEPPIDSKSFSRLFLGFSRRILALGYNQVSLDRKYEEVNDRVRVTEKFYFKPPLQLLEEGQLISQLYGNVALEKITIDNQPSYIKLLTTIYSDRLFQDAKPFDEFMDRLFEKS